MATPLRYFLLGLTILLSGCAGNTENSKTTGGRGQTGIHAQKVVKTTAYTDSEAGRRSNGVKNAIGTRLQSGSVNSAAADWSRFPMGTKFRVVDNDQTYVVDDYGPEKSLELL